MNPVLQEILHNITARLAALEQIAESDKVLINLIQEQRAEIDRLRTIPPSKPWVGLSAGEVEIYGNQFNGIQLAKEIEGILKERNT